MKIKKKIYFPISNIIILSALTFGCNVIPRPVATLDPGLPAEFIRPTNTIVPFASYSTPFDVGHPTTIPISAVLNDSISVEPCSCNVSVIEKNSYGFTTLVVTNEIDCTFDSGIGKTHASFSAECINTGNLVSISLVCRGTAVTPLDSLYTASIIKACGT